MAVIIIPQISRFARTYVKAWAKENNITFTEALDEIVCSVRRDAEADHDDFERD